MEDSYGDNGLVSVIIGKIQGNECHIELWLMSCRVIKRTMEHAMLDALVARCRDLGIETIMGYYYKTAKNGIVRRLYKDFGFDAVSTDKISAKWCLQVNRYTNKNNHIKVKYE